MFQYLQLRNASAVETTAEAGSHSRFKTLVSTARQPLLQQVLCSHLIFSSSSFVSGSMLTLGGDPVQTNSYQLLLSFGLLCRGASFLSKFSQHSHRLSKSWKTPHSNTPLTRPHSVLTAEVSAPEFWEDKRLVARGLSHLRPSIMRSSQRILEHLPVSFGDQVLGRWLFQASGPQSTR